MLRLEIPEDVLIKAVSDAGRLNLKPNACYVRLLRTRQDLKSNTVRMAAQEAA